MRNALYEFSAALAILFVAVVARWLIDPFLNGIHPLVTFYAAVAFAVWLGGMKQGTFVSILGYILGSYFFIEPRGFLGLSQSQNIVGLFAYLGTCAIIIGLGQATRNARYRADFKTETLAVTLASMVDGVITTDNQCRITSMNPVAENLTGYPGGSGIGKPLEEVFRIAAEETNEPLVSPAFRALQQGGVESQPTRTILIGRNGTIKPIEESATPILDHRRQIAGVVLIFRDISDRRALEQEIQARLSAARLLASIVESSEDAIVSKTRRGIIQTWNKGAERLFGHRADEVIGKHISIIIPEERSKEEELILSQIAAGQSVEHFDTVRIRKDGVRFDISLTVSPIRDDQGRIIGASKIARDITKRKQLETALQARERDLSDFFHNSVIGLHWISPAGVILRANRADLQLIGYPLNEYLGRNVAEFHTDQKLVAQLMDAVRNGRPVHSLPAKLRCKSGEIKDVLIDASAFYEDGQLVHARCFVRDVTDRNRAEEALLEANRRKDEFLAVLAHELRNPLAPIRNWLQILKTTDRTQSATSTIHDSIDRQVSQMVRLIDDLLDVSRITRNKLILRQEPIDLADVIHQSVDSCRAQIEASRLDLEVELPADPILVSADHVRLSQVFGNLLTNSCKFTDAGGKITVIVVPNGDSVKIRIGDSGVGIPPEMLPRIFEMFTQVDGNRHRSQGGLGIGLSLVKRLVEMHGGTIEATSQGEGFGSEFVITLPMISSPASLQLAESNRISTPTLTKQRILVVDDNVDSALSLAMLLQLTGHETQTAHDGEDAVRKAESFAPQVILLDIGLPKMDGLQACQAIRSQPWGQKIVMIALTGWGQDDDRQKSHAAGFNGHLVKPVDHAQLMSLLSELIASN